MFKEIKIEKIESRNYKGKVYNFEVKGDESFILNNLVVHNCLSMDGRIVDIDDDIAKSDIFHSGCRGIWVEILKDEAELPKVTGVPDSLLKRYKGGVNDLDQLDKPIVQKGSLADDYWKGELSKENKGI